MDKNEIINDEVGKGVLFLDNKDSDYVNAIAMQFDYVNRNRRLYTRDAVERGLQRLNLPVHASDGHPGQGNGTDTFGRKVIKWLEAEIVDGVGSSPPTVRLKGKLTKTQAAQDLRGFLEDNDPIGLSTRGIINEYSNAQDQNGGYHHVTDLDFRTWDIVDDPASDGTYLSFDSVQDNEISNLLFDNFSEKENITVKEETKMDDNVKNEETTQNQNSGDNGTAEVLAKVLERVEKFGDKIAELERNSVTSKEDLQRQFDLADQKKFEMDCTNEQGIIGNKLPRLIQEARISSELAEECEETIMNSIKARQTEVGGDIERYREVIDREVARFLDIYGRKTLDNQLRTLNETDNRYPEASAAASQNAGVTETGAVSDIQDNAPPANNKNYGPTVRKTFNDVGPMSMNVLRDVPDYTHITYDIANKFLGETKSLQRFSDRIVPHGQRDWTRDGMQLDPNMRILQKLLDEFDKEHASEMADGWAAWMDYERSRYSKYTNAERAQYKSSWFLDTIVTGTGTNQIPLTRLFSRALVMITYPMLMTTSVFNFDTVMAEETEIYIDARSSLRDTGNLVTVVNAVPASTSIAAGGTYNLNVRNVSSYAWGAGAGTAFVAETTAGNLPSGLILDRYNGVIHNPTNASVDINAAITHVQILYAPYVNAENTAISGKLDLAPTKLTIKTVSNAILASISEEAERYAVAQTAWNARTRALFNIAYDMVEKIDHDVLGLAQFASDLNGNTPSAPVDIQSSNASRSANLVTAIGDARATISSLDYPIDAIIGSPKAIQVLREWDGYKNDGYPDSRLMPNSMVSMFQGVRVFETTQMPDNALLVSNGETVYHRTFSGKAGDLKGPFEGRDSAGGIKRTNEWYTETWDWAGIIRGDNSVKINLTV